MPFSISYSDIIVTADELKRFESVNRLKIKRDNIAPVNVENTAISFNQQSSDIGTRERETIYKIVITLAIVAYNYDPNALKSDVVQRIAYEAEALHMKIDVDTVRKHLKSSAKQLGVE